VTPGGPQGLNRYSYGLNNPVKYNDPTGHCVGPLAVICVAVITFLAMEGPQIAEMVNYAVTMKMVMDQYPPVYQNGEKVNIGIFIPSSPGVAPLLDFSNQDFSIPLNIGNSADNPPRPDLYRSGNSTSPRIDNVRLTGENPDVQIVNDLVKPNSGGMSTFDDPDKAGSGPYMWKYPSDAPDPQGINIVNDEPNHWSWQSAGSVTLDQYKQNLTSVNDYWLRLYKVKKIK
jgi:hypothetical protein